MRTTVEMGTDYDVAPEDYREYVDGDNGEGIAPIKTETRIVGDVTVREFPARSWTPQQYAMPANVNVPQLIAGAAPQRTELEIRMLSGSTGTCYLAATKESCTVDGGFMLEAGQSVEFHHTGPVWAIADDVLYLSVRAEFRDGGS